MTFLRVSCGFRAREFVVSPSSPELIALGTVEKRNVMESVTLVGKLAHFVPWRAELRYSWTTEAIRSVTKLLRVAFTSKTVIYDAES